MKSLLRFLLPAFALWMAAAPSGYALDFTLHSSQTVAGDVPQTKSYFTDGESKIFVDVPGGWKVNSSPAALDFLPPQAACQVLIQQAGSAPWPFDEAGKIALRKRVQDSIPPGAKAVVPLAEQEAVVPLAGWTSFEVAHSYEFFGQKMQRAVLFLNLPQQRVWQVTVTAPEADFKNIHEQMRVMLYDLFEPEKMLSGEALARYQKGITD